MQEFKIRKVTEKVDDRAEKFYLVKKRTITLKQASQELGLSYRHTLRLYKRYKEGRIMALAFQRNHPAWNKTPEKTKELSIQMKKEYSDYNTLHLYDLFKERYPDKKLPYSTFRNILDKAKLLTHKQKRRSKF